MKPTTDRGTRRIDDRTSVFRYEIYNGLCSGRLLAAEMFSLISLSFINLANATTGQIFVKSVHSSTQRKSCCFSVNYTKPKDDLCHHVKQVNLSNRSKAFSIPCTSCPSILMLVLLDTYPLWKIFFSGVSSATGEFAS